MSTAQRLEIELDADLRQALKEADAGDFAADEEVDALFEKWEKHGDQVA